jgi:hypothetical protein
MNAYPPISTTRKIHHLLCRQGCLHNLLGVHQGRIYTERGLSRHRHVTSSNGLNSLRENVAASRILQKRPSDDTFNLALLSSPVTRISRIEDMAGITTILVTGGSGLVGRAVQWVVENNPQSAPVNENWVFLSSSDGDLR